MEIGFNYNSRNFELSFIFGQVGSVPTHEDYRGLERTKESLVDVAQYKNEVKHDSEHLMEIQQVKGSRPDLNLAQGKNLE